MSKLAGGASSLCKTENGALQAVSAGSSCLDLYAKIGAMRNMPVGDQEKMFMQAAMENEDLALRILLYAHDVREGAGERQVFKNLFPLACALQSTDGFINLDLVWRLLNKIPELGRWDTLVALMDKVPETIQILILDLIHQGLQSGNGLCAKWMPRQGKVANRIRGYINKRMTSGELLTPKSYRKMLVSMSKTIEQLMSAGQWDAINYEHVPSVAMSRTKKAFSKHDGDRFGAYLTDVTSGEKKINASAVFPYDVIRDMSDPQATQAQWMALPDYLKDTDGDSLVMADVSGSMEMHAVGGEVYPLHVAIGMAIYIAERNKGQFRNEILTFSEVPTFFQLNPSWTVCQKFEHIKQTTDPFNTDVALALMTIAQTCIDRNLSPEDMPKRLILISDMQFDCPHVAGYGKHPWKTNHQAVKAAYAKLGLKLPDIVYWNVDARAEKGQPVTMHDSGVAMISGFSPAVMKSVFKTALNPITVMLETVMVPRYDLNSAPVLPRPVLMKTAKKAERPLAFGAPANIGAPLNARGVAMTAFDQVKK